MTDADDAADIDLIERLHTRRDFVSNQGNDMTKELTSHLPAAHGWTLIQPVGDCVAVYEQPVIGWFVHTSLVGPETGDADGELHTTVRPFTAEGAWSHDDEEFLLRHVDGTLLAPNNAALQSGASALEWFRERRARLGQPLASADAVKLASWT